MTYRRLTSTLVAVGCMVALHAWAEGPAGKAIEQRDHPALVTFYKHQAEEFRDKAKHWDGVAESYERHPDQAGKDDPKKHAAHCRAIAKSYRAAAEEADALVTEHRAMLPHGMLQ